MTKHGGSALGASAIFRSGIFVLLAIGGSMMVGCANEEGGTPPIATPDASTSPMASDTMTMADDGGSDRSNSPFTYTSIAWVPEDDPDTFLDLRAYGQYALTIIKPGSPPKEEQEIGTFEVDGNRFRMTAVWCRWFIRAQRSRPSNWSDAGKGSCMDPSGIGASFDYTNVRVTPSRESA